ncbi:DUF2336 domain-containing protein [Roseibium aquae]|uniref:DUF2336 domain-containing protein n=1 Tax=Roseibium aquae TaxID=1323746 RepID=UPI00123CBBE7|nr:DUF2336 domain-containing protein [Roseibium aquae]
MARFLNPGTAMPAPGNDQKELCVAMIIRDFLNWVSTAPDGPRAEAAGALARAWLYSDMPDGEREGAAIALTLLLDDPCINVRQALAENLARSEAAPVHVIRSLAGDLDEVAEPVLARSPVLGDMELVDLAANGSDRVQSAIARRPFPSAAVCAALCEIGSAAACTILLDNPTSRILVSGLNRLGERFASCAAIRERLLKRADTPLILRHDLLQGLAVDYHNVLEEGELPGGTTPSSRCDDASDRVILRLAAVAGDNEMRAFVQHLRDRAKLNTRLLLRAVCCGRLRFFASALSLLGKVPEQRLRETLSTIRPSVLQAVLRKAGLPMRAHSAFLMVINLIQRENCDFRDDLPCSTTRRLTEELLHELQDESLGADLDVLAFVRQFAAEAARLEARAYVVELCRPALAAPGDQGRAAA